MPNTIHPNPVPATVIAQAQRMTVADLIAGLQHMPPDAIVHGCNRDILEIEYKRAAHSFTLEVIGHRTEAAAAYIRDAFVDPFDSPPVGTCRLDDPTT